MKHVIVLMFTLLILHLPVAQAGETTAGSAGTTTIAAQSDSVEAESDAEFSEDIFDENNNDEQNTQMVPDPLYHFNRAMFTFNDYLYFYGLKPVAQGYKAVVPTVARQGINNFFNNLLFPVRFVNKVLQGKGEAAAMEFSAFFVNSTIGILGFNNFAQKHMDINLNDEDLGQTLGSYNIGDGFYLVLPVLGPSTLRDTVGRVGDWFITPVNYVEPWEAYWGMQGVDKVNRTAFRIGDYEALKDASLDPYVALRNAYIQNRRSLIKQ